ncbi:TetR/AcrR family transcriptional regulator [Nonomuraea angiospora]|uniref:AcrR family transcriptional regulator n=1 Tax=Nonomuraea angiospora TaxID=46172 RepID=A0ABR9MFZ5_9ACTN|nr:TetR/AcrR family transcriptional regulator [Nonomuraea angiospora]MBE1591432.1 AcrR family transcriptional regulator [Nonomuraea angiospora]MDX3108521.1 TetR/AcrR family transcriptional regulator [Nonomuraea angiospora]
MVTDHRKLPRRRGEALNTAIFQATLDELAEAGYAGLTMERVAERAKASKASLYRRWPTRIELVMDAVYNSLPAPGSAPDTGNLRDDLVAMLRMTSKALSGPAGEAMRGLLGEALSSGSPLRALRKDSQSTTRRLMAEVVGRAVERGEVAPEAVTPRRLDAGHALLRHHFLFEGSPIPDELVVAIVDEVLVPLFTRG